MAAAVAAAAPAASPARSSSGAAPVAQSALDACPAGAAAMAASPRPSPLGLFYTSLHDRNVGTFRLIMESVLPVRYADDVYKKLVATPQDFTKLVYFHDTAVAAIGGRVEGEGAGKRLYVMVLAVLPAYQRRGIGKEVFQSVLDILPKHPDITSVYLHVHVGNEDAQRFYAGYGFKRGERLVNYYRGVEPPDAYVMTLDITPPAAAAPAAAAPAPASS